MNTDHASDPSLSSSKNHPDRGPSRATSRRTVPRVGALVALFALSAGCAYDGSDRLGETTQEISTYGTLNIPLVTTINDVEYRMSGGQITLRGPVTRTITLEGDGPAVRLPPGTYVATVDGGWTLQRTQGGVTAGTSRPAPFTETTVVVTASEQSGLEMRVDVLARALGLTTAINPRERPHAELDARSLSVTACESSLVAVDILSRRIDVISGGRGCGDSDLPQAVADFNAAFIRAQTTCTTYPGHSNTWQFDLVSLWPTRAGDACPALGLGGSTVTVQQPTRPVNYVAPVPTACEMALDSYGRLGAMFVDHGGGLCLDPTIGDIYSRVIEGYRQVGLSCPSEQVPSASLEPVVRETYERCFASEAVVRRCPGVTTWIHIAKRALWWTKDTYVNSTTYQCATEYDTLQCNSQRPPINVLVEKGFAWKSISVTSEWCTWPGYVPPTPTSACGAFGCFDGEQCCNPTCFTCAPANTCSEIQVTCGRVSAG